MKTHSWLSITAFLPPAALYLFDVPPGSPSQTRLAWNKNSATSAPIGAIKHALEGKIDKTTALRNAERECLGRSNDLPAHARERGCIVLKAGSAQVSKKTSGYGKASKQKAVFLIVAIVPSFLGYVLFTLYPNLMSVYYSLLQWDGLTDAVFVGLDNYLYMFKDQFVWRALYHNLIYIVVVPILTVFISLLLAYLLNNKSYKENSFYKILYFFTNVLSTVVIALLWSFIFDGSFGLLNGLLELFGMKMNDFYWLGNSKTALWALIIPMVWGAVGLYVVIFINAMSAVPKSLYEAALLEGAKSMTILFKITIPLIRNVIRVCVVFIVLGTLKGFEIIMILTNGGPEGSTDVIGLYMFNLAFGKEAHSYGYASAIGMLLFVILIGAKLIVDKLYPAEDLEY